MFLGYTSWTDDPGSERATYYRPHRAAAQPNHTAASTSGDSSHTPVTSPPDGIGTSSSFVETIIKKFQASSGKF